MEEIGEPVASYKRSSTLEKLDEIDYFEIALRGAVLEACSLPEGYADPTGRTLNLNLLMTAEEVDSLALEVGKTYLVWGTNYEDSDMLYRKTLAGSEGSKPSDYDWSDIQWFDEPTYKEVYTDQPEVLVYGIYRTKGGGNNITDSDLYQINSSRFDVYTRDYFYQRNTEEHWETGELIYPTEEFLDTYHLSGIKELSGSAADFLRETSDESLQHWLSLAEVNNHAFPIVAAENLNAIPTFSSQEAVLTEGRGFTEAEQASGAPVCVISESLAAANGLSVGDTVTLQYYEQDIELSAPESLLANPTAAYYSSATGFTCEPLEYEIVGLYRQNNEWNSGIYAFTPNTVFVPKASVRGETTSTCGGIYTSVLIDNGAADQVQQYAAEQGFPDLMLYHDQGYTQIMENLTQYYSVGITVLRAGIALWLVLLLLYLLLFPVTLRSDLRRMWSLGTPTKYLRRHILKSSLAVLLPGTLAGLLAAKLLFGRLLSLLLHRAGLELTLTLHSGVLSAIAAAQLLVTLLAVYLAGLLLTTRAKQTRRQ